LGTFILGEVVGQWEKGPRLKNIIRWCETEEGIAQMVDFIFTSETETLVNESMYGMSRYVELESDPKLFKKIDESITAVRTQRSGLVAPGAPNGNIQR